MTELWHARHPPRPWWRSPDLVEAILGGWADQRVMLEQLERPLPVGWEEQRRNLLLSRQSAQ
jgi:hypothetical protein